MRSRLAVAIAVIAASIAAVTGAAVQPAGAAVSALLIGDSVMHGMAQPYGAPARADLAARHSYILDSAGCRRLITTSCRIGDGPTPANAITVLRSRAGQFDRAIVVAVGYNDPPSGNTGVGEAIDTLVAEARRQGIPNVIWLTYREAGSAANISRFRANNAVVRAKTAVHPELRIADWASRSASLPAGWFSADGVHLGSSAASAMADLIGDALDALGPPLPVRCAPTLWTGTTPPALTSPPAGSTPAGGVRVLTSPIRLIDTRSGPGVIGAGRTVPLVIAGIDGVPADAVAAIINVTSVDSCAPGFVTAYPCGTAVPTASVLNLPDGATVANSAVVRLGDGDVCVFTSQATDLVVDLTAFVAPAGALTAAVDPRRLIDTRLTQQRLPARTGLTLDITAVPEYTPSATAVTVNLTATSPAGSGFLTALPGPCPANPAVPATSNVNVVSGRDAAASATVGIVDGTFCVYSSVETDVVVDLQAIHGSTGSQVEPVQPTRLVDTRASHRVEAGTELRLSLDVLPGVPAHVTAAVVNLTAVDPVANGYLSLYPCGSGATPTVSNLNVRAGSTVANRALVATGGQRTICAFSSVPTDLVVDIEAWVAAPSVP